MQPSLERAKAYLNSGRLKLIITVILAILTVANLILLVASIPGALAGLGQPGLLDRAVAVLPFIAASCFFGIVCRIIQAELNHR